MNKGVGIVLQARMNSKRLPGKVMKMICGKPIIGHILDRLRLVENSDMIITATTKKVIDDIIEEYSYQQGVVCFRGDEDDVLNRFYDLAQYYDLYHIVRATGDNPLVDYEEIERLIALHLKSRADYTHAFGQLPVGIGVDCFTIDALKRSWAKGLKQNHREHINEYIQERPEFFSINELDIPLEKKASSLRLTVDTLEDFRRVDAIYKKADKPGVCITTQEAIRLCDM
jgi:spore coat polysaccharide biosynthesis protein SpsF